MPPKIRTIIPRDDGPRRKLDLPEPCLRHLPYTAVGAAVPPAIAGRPVYGRVRVLNSDNSLSKPFWGAR